MPRLFLRALRAGAMLWSGALAKLNDAASVALGRPVFGERGVLLHCFALFGEFEAGCAAGLGFAVEGLGLGRGAAHFAEDEDLNLKEAGFVFDLEHVAGVDFAGGFGAEAVGLDAADVASLAGEGAGFEEARSPEPFVDANGIHRSMVLKAAVLRRA